MRSNIKPENRRLLEAIEYIDGDIVLGVLGGLKDPVENYESGEYKKPSPFKHWRQFTALAACLLLLSAAIPVLNYAVQRFGTGTWDGNAGAGSEELEVPTQAETQALETENEITETEIIDSGFDKYLESFADMSAYEIYAEVLKGGWVVIGEDRSDFTAGGELWFDFFEKSQKGDPAVALVAKYNPNYSRDDINEAVIFLTEIVYNGDSFYHKCIFSLTNEIIAQGEYKFLKKDEYNYVANGQEIHSEAYILTNNIATTWQEGYDEIFSSKMPDVSFWKENEVPVSLHKYK